MKPINPIISNESPREILAKDFKSLNGGLPIRGGWGYSKDDACIINRIDPLVDPSSPFNGIRIEYIFIEKRIYEEMIIFRPDGEKFFDIRWTLLKQDLLFDNGKPLDKLVFEISALHEGEYPEMKREFTEAFQDGRSLVGDEVWEQKLQGKPVKLIREYWFDISSFFGAGV